MNRRQGFTLLEVLVALAIVTLAWTGIATALPMLLAPSPLDRAGDDVEAMLRRARAAALAGSRPVVVSAVADGRALAVPALGERLDMPRSVGVELRGVAGWTGRTTEGRTTGGRATAGGAAIVFLPDGSSSGGQVSLAEVAEGTAVAEHRVVRVAWLTGHIERR